jgi:hypothetical protein
MSYLLAYLKHEMLKGSEVVVLGEGGKYIRLSTKLGWRCYTSWFVLDIIDTTTMTIITVVTLINNVEEGLNSEITWILLIVQLI